MIQLENQHWGEGEHTVFDMPFTGQIQLHSFSGEELEESQQEIFARTLTDSATTKIQEAIVTTDEVLPIFSLILRMEADSETDAFQRLCHAAINGWVLTGHEAEDLEYINAHLVDSFIFHQGNPTGSLVHIGNDDYLLHAITMPEFNEATEDLVVRDPRDVFICIRDDA